jgi:hypothetical protein
MYLPAFRWRVLWFFTSSTIKTETRAEVTFLINITSIIWANTLVFLCGSLWHINTHGWRTLELCGIAVIMNWNWNTLNNWIVKLEKNSWYFDSPAYLLIRNEGGSKYHMGGSVFNKGDQYTMDENWPRGQNTIWHRL